MDTVAGDKRFPRSAKYAPEWVAEHGFGGNPLWMAEWLCEALALQPGMRVLDLGCGRAKSSIFLAREFGAEVWATDLWVAASENLQRIRDAGLEGQVYPIHADARALPFAGEFFDAVVAIDCFPYFGTDELYLNYLVNFVKPAGALGICGAGLMQEFTAGVPGHLREMWSQDFWALHSAPWWQQHWQKTELVDVETADSLEKGWQYWCQWHKQTWPENTLEPQTLEKDAGEYLGIIRMVAKRRPDVELVDYCWPDALRSFPSAYEKVEMLRKAE